MLRNVDAEDEENRSDTQARSYYRVGPKSKLLYRDRCFKG